MNKYISISELSKRLNLINLRNNKPLNYVLRYWEKEFIQIRQKIINKRRYYSSQQVEIMTLIKYLIKNKGMTIKGAKNVLNSKIINLDDYKSYSLKTDYQKKKIKSKREKILDKIKKLKRYGKKKLILR